MSAAQKGNKNAAGHKNAAGNISAHRRAVSIYTLPLGAEGR